MQARSYQTIGVDELGELYNREKPDNEDARQGYALVNVLGREAYAAEHIRQSINIPVKDLDLFEQQFDKDKKLIVYCASPDCDASPKAAGQLAERGFNKVIDFEEGLAGWKRAGYETRGEKSSLDETS